MDSWEDILAIPSMRPHFNHLFTVDQIKTDLHLNKLFLFEHEIFHVS